MARAGSPSPAMEFAGGLSGGSPQPQQVSKRDKRRNMLADKLSDMITSFSENRDLHYRAQVAAIQSDITLIMKADPYANKPLEDSGAETVELSNALTGGNTPTVPSPPGDYTAQVGRYYSQFVDSVNDALEARDIGLTMLWVCTLPFITLLGYIGEDLVLTMFRQSKYEKSLQEIKQMHEYKLHLAQEEHLALKNTLRERLVQQLSQRRSRLMKEKEQLDIADSNALLLHPNQFSITNPASPGGPQNPRKTRHTRHRAGDPDDLVSASVAAENKRKRKAALEDEGGSPGPHSRIDLGIGSPFREAKNRTSYAQFEASAYSVDRLFTEKELLLATNTAAVATQHFFTKLHNGDGATNGVNGDHVGDEDSTNGLNDDRDDREEDATPSAAPDMTRTASQSHHATRGAVRNNPGGAGGLLLDPADYLAEIHGSQSRNTFRFPNTGPVLTTTSVTALNKPNAAAPTPSPLNADEIAQDMRLISREIPPDDPINEQLLQLACGLAQSRNGQTITGLDPGDSAGGPPVRPAAAFLEVAGGVPMSAQSSMGGYSDVGGAVGAVGMRRTASGAGARRRLL